MPTVSRRQFLASTDRTLDDPQVFRVEPGATVRLRLINAATATNFWIDLDRLEGRLIAVDGMAVEPLSGRRFEFAIAQRLDITLELPRGEGTWPIFALREGERVEITFTDQTTMARPMHLHGHHFQVVAINGERFAGAMRATVLVPGRGSVTVAFDASNPGKWALHCHHLYHMAGGMMTTLEYEG